MEQIPSFQFHDLHAFVVTVETGQMTAAARRLGITQSAISHAMARLERAFGIALLDRQVRPLRPTAAGRQVADYARRLLQDAHDFERRVGVGTANPPRDLRIGLVDSLETPFVPLFVQRLSDHVGRLAINSGLVVEHRQAFLDHDLDMLLTTDGMESYDGLERHSVITEPYCVIVPAGRFPGDGLPSVTDLTTRLPLIRSSARTLTGTHIETQLRRMRMDIPKYYEFDSFESVVSMVEAGLGWAVLAPISLYKARSDLSKIEVHPFPGPRFSRTLYFIARTNEFGDMPLKAADVARDILRKHYLPELRRIGSWITEATALG